MEDRLVILKPDELTALIEEAVKSGIHQFQADLQTGRKLTLAQLADEWQCSEQAIFNWMKRVDFPLPVHYIGSDPRFHRYEVDAWSRAEAARKKAKKKEKVN